MIRPLLALFTRALRDDARARLPVILRAIAALLLLLFVWLNEADFATSSAPGQELLLMLAMVNFFGLTFVGLATFCSAITEEKEEETLGLLRMTRLNPLAILLGKSTARLVGGLLFLAVQMPFTMLCMTLGGAGKDQILHVYAILAAYLFFLCNLGLLWSVLCRRTIRAVLLTIITGLALYVLPAMIWFSLMAATRTMLRGTDLGPFANVMVWLVQSNPINDLLGTVMGRRGWIFSADSLPLHLIGGGVCFALAWLLFEKFCTNLDVAVPRRASSSARIRRARRPRPKRWALAWKDYQFLAGGKRGLYIRFIIYTALVVALIAWTVPLSRQFDDRGAAQIIRAVALIMLSVELGLGGARIFGVERKRQTLGTIFILPTSASRLAWQKFAGCALALLPSLVLLAIGWLIEPPAYHGQYPGYLLATRAFTFIQFVFFPVLVAYLSLRMRRGALLTGFLTIFIGNILSQLIFSRFIVRNWYTDYYDRYVAEYFWFLVATLAITAAFLIRAIPRRLEQCAAEE